MENVGLNISISFYKISDFLLRLFDTSHKVIHLFHAFEANDHLLTVLLPLQGSF